MFFDDEELSRREFLKRAGVAGGAAAAGGVLGDMITPSPTRAAEMPERILIGWTPPDVTGVFKTATDYFERSAAEAREHGVPAHIITKSAPGHTAFGSQVAIIENFITMGVDAIAVSPIEVKVVKPALQKAAEAGIGVIVVNLLDPIEGLDADSYIGFDNRTAGRISGYALIDYLGGPGILGKNQTVSKPPVEKFLTEEWWTDEVYAGTDLSDLDIEANIAEIEGIAGGFFARKRHQGFWEDVVSNVPGINLVKKLAADWNREKGTNAAQDILTAHPEGTLDAIYAQSTEMGIGAMNACEGAGRLKTADEPVDGPGVAVFTNDGTPESLGYIREGKMIAETWHGFPEWGWFGTRMAVRAALGLDTKQKFDIKPRTEYQGNADQFYPDPALDIELYGYNSRWGSWEAIKQELKM